MVFTVLGAVAELERSLIVERVKAGVRNARAEGKHIGRPRVIVDCSQDYRAAQERGILGDGLPKDGTQQGYGAAGHSQLAQK